MNTCLLAVLALAASVPALAGDRDVARAAPLLPPHIDASENTQVNYVGTLPVGFAAALDADDSTFNRPNTCAALSGIGTAVAFDTITITNATSSAANFTVSSSLPGGGACSATNDTFFVLYGGPFAPASPLANCLAINDDIAGAQNRCSSLTFGIPAAGTRTVVTAGFNNATGGGSPGLFAYDISFAGTDGPPTGMLVAGNAIVDFSRQPTGSTSTRVQTLSNVGTSALTVSALSPPVAPFAFAAGGTCPAPPIALGAGASCTVAYSFSSTAEGQFAQLLTATSNGGNVSYTLRGTALASIQLPASGAAGRLVLLLLLAAAGIAGTRRGD